MATLTLAPNCTWFAPTVSTVTRASITQINIVDSYTATGNETTSWDASVDKDGSVMCYVAGTVLTIAGNGSGRIYANADSSWVFSDSSQTDYFKALTTINGGDKLDTSNATNMYVMFYRCTSLTSLDVSNWDVSNVTDMAGMFGLCTSLASLDVSNWDVSNVTSMGSMFSMSTYGSIKSALTELDVSKWDTSSCADISFMFYGLNGVDTLDVSNWDVSKVTTFDHMVAHSYITLIGTENWNVTSACTNMNAMFYSAQNTVLDVSKYDTSNVTCFDQMFEHCNKLTKIIGLENFNTANSYGFSEMFQYCFALKELDLSSFDTRKAKDGAVASGNGTKTTTMSFMFQDNHRLEKITLGENFTFKGDGTTTDTSHYAVLPTPSASYITGADGYWYNTNEDVFLAANVPNNVADTYVAIPTYHTVTVADATGGTLSVDKTSAKKGETLTLTATPTNGYAYNGATITYTISGGSESSIILGTDSPVTFTMPMADVTITPNWDLVQSIPTLAANSSWYKSSTARSTITEINIVDKADSIPSTAWDASEAQDKSVMAWIDGTILTISGNGCGRIYANADSSYAFSNSASDRFSNVTAINGASLLDTSNATTFKYMFNFAFVLTSVDVSGWNTENITDMFGMFNSCFDITHLAVDDWNMSNVTDMSALFQHCRALTSLRVDNWNTTSCTLMPGVFAGCYDLTSIDVSNWDVSNVTNMYAMFYQCTSLASLDVSNWDVSNVTNMEYLFYKCTSLASLDVSNWDVSNVTNMSYAFTDMRQLEKITLGGKFAFKSSNSVLPAPSASYIAGADGYWYTRHRMAYAPSDIPDNVVQTYYASLDIVNNIDYLIKNGTILGFADKIRVLSGTEDTMLPSDMNTSLESANAEVDIQTDLIAQITAALEGKTLPDSDGDSSGGSSPMVTSVYGENDSNDTFYITVRDNSTELAAFRLSDGQSQTVNFNATPLEELDVTVEKETTNDYAIIKHTYYDNEYTIRMET